MPGFVYLEAPIGEDPDKRDYIVSNARIEATGIQTRMVARPGHRRVDTRIPILKDPFIREFLTGMFMTRTPLRISFFGGGTDYPEHYRKAGGQTLGVADQSIFLHRR